ncbi:unnamed protein product [[Candida] boidinii]|uniref:Mediator of RNA polymerase II transcription subunit 7 n=1 Tax=Candida boidinii TaxID=5477 RepID=A0A9W6T4H0_CANBO|nr:hypothetical protein B5S30_g3634 [[Candida] boidinii]GME77616.1 unnamed protein product [[Candida] boidinii]GMF99899.1 unnamed protein product [[Candida] boidinii]
MAENQEAGDELVSSLYPPPPPYITFFTEDNHERLGELRREGKTDEEISKIRDIKFLVPPSPPDRPNYRSFGDMWNFQDKPVSLEESGVPQLYESNNNVKSDSGDTEETEEEVFTTERINELKKMTKSLLLNFLEFIGIISKNPTYAQEKIENIRVILINIHHLLNSYRLHQSRESLILKFEQKISEDLKSIKKINDTCDLMEKQIKRLVQEEIDAKISNMSIDSNSQDTNAHDFKETNQNDIKALKKEAIAAMMKNIET